jgi:hypothetical protein
MIDGYCSEIKVLKEKQIVIEVELQELKSTYLFLCYEKDSVDVELASLRVEILEAKKEVTLCMQIIRELKRALVNVEGVLVKTRNEIKNV